MTTPNFGWNLPPGCSQRDIDRAMGADEPEPIDCETCESTGYENISECCGQPFIAETDFCSQCKEHAGKCKCEVCKGEGWVIPESPEPDYECDEPDYDDQADFAQDEPRDRSLDSEK